jgi:transposase-like protein
MTRTKRSSEEWFSLIKECRSSGLAVRDFCSIKGIHPSNFYYWAKRQRTTNEPGFVPVTITQPSAPAMSQQIVEIVYPNGVSMRLSSEIDIRILAQLIRL